MSEIKDILTDIEQHCRREYQGRYADLSIGRGVIRISGISDPQKLWIVNKEYQMRSRIEFDINNTFKGTSIVGRPQNLEDDGRVISKNKEYARALLENYQGTHVNRTADGRVFNFMIKNSASYINDGGNAYNLRFGIAGDEDWSIYTSVRKALEAIGKNAESIKERQLAEEAAKKKAEELRRQKQEEEARKVEEEARKLEQERLALEAERQALIDKYNKATAFIRKQVALRNNPVLDKNQNAAKFSNVFNGVAEVINGGPGTGKTTTMIQRLKLLIDKGDLEDFRANHLDCKLTDKEIDIVTGTDNWVYFSPNQLLKKYLQDNMNYEGLTQTNQRTIVWKDYLTNVVRDKYVLAGQDCPFDFAKRRYENIPIFIGDHFAIISSFIDFFIAQTKEKYLRISRVDTKRFNWNILGGVIKKECEKINNVQSLTDLLKFLIQIERADEHVFVEGRRIIRGAAINDEFNEEIQLLADNTMVLIKRDEAMLAAATKFVNDLKASRERQEEEEDEDEMAEEEVDYGDVIIDITRRVRALLRKLALKTEDSSTKIQGRDLALYEIIKPVVKEEDVKKLGQSAYFIKYVYPALRGSLQSIFSTIPRIYKNFRKSLSDDMKEHWNPDILQYILETTKNRALCPQEQALLVGFINRICRDYYRVRPQDFEKSNHKYVLAYKELCRPVIGVDEATDYSIVDFFAIRSFGHYQVESFTLCGDTMQMMREDGIKDWEVLHHPLIFENLNVKELKVSYRQSKELMDLAGKIYEEETGRKSPYECYLKNMDTPKPLWLESGDIDDKAEWIADRILEVYRNYGEFPTIAVFTKDKETGERLKEALDDCDELANAGMKVRVCSEEALADPTIIRIFPIEEVKGMEFEVAFFYDIDDLDSTSIVNRYLYVGISRAAMYLAVTSTGRSRKISDLLEKYFVQGEDWR